MRRSNVGDGQGEIQYIRSICKSWQLGFNYVKNHFNLTVNLLFFCKYIDLLAIRNQQSLDMLIFHP